RVPSAKADAVAALGAEVRRTGASQDAAMAEVESLARDQGALLVPPFDHPDIIAGQGTIGLELMEALPDLATVIVPLSGGGLIAGIAVAVKSINRNATVIGVSMDRGAAMHARRVAGRPGAAVEEPTLGDSLRGRAWG